MSSKAKQKGVRKMGWLSKRGGRIHTWHKRWFVLTGDLLFYYKSPQDSRPTGTIPLAGNKVIRHPDDPKQPTSFRFEILSGRDRQGITSTHETYLISADTAEEADKWLTAIRRVMHEPYGGGMFGRSLEETMQVEARLGGNYVPVLLHRCIKFVRDHGLDEVGIFRLPGQTSRIQTLKEHYDQGSQQDFQPNEDVHTVASLLKLYLRELPEPVVPFVFYDSFRSATKLYEANKLEALDEVKRLLIQLPKVNFNVLKYLSRFLNEVQANSEVNKMPSLNLATMFGPNLLRPETNNPQVLMECNSLSTDFVCIMIDRHEDFFPITNDEKPPKRLSVVKAPDELPLIWHESKLATRSVYNPKGSKAELYRPRQNSVPLNPQGKPKSSKVASIVEQYNKKSKGPHRLSVSKSAEFCSSIEPEGHRPVVTMPILTHWNGLPQNGLPQNGLSQNGLTNEEDDSEDDNIIPIMMNRFSGLDKPRAQSDTLSSEVIVNSISKEMEVLERQLDVAREEAARYKKAARLWKTRFEQEKRARLAAEEQIQGLQGLIDETFKQFALDDSEDDFEEDSEDSVYNGESGGGTPETRKRVAYTNPTLSV